MTVHAVLRSRPSNAASETRIRPQPRDESENENYANDPTAYSRPSSIMKTVKL